MEDDGMDLAMADLVGFPPNSYLEFSDDTWLSFDSCHWNYILASLLWVSKKHHRRLDPIQRQYHGHTRDDFTNIRSTTPALNWLPWSRFEH